MRNIWRKGCFLGVIGLCLLGFSACEKARDSKESAMLEEVSKPLKLEANNGTILMIDILQKNPTFSDILVTSEQSNLKALVFFTTWCDPCRGIFPHLERLLYQFGESIALFGIPIDDLVEDVGNFTEILKVFSKENGLNMPLIVDAKRAQLFKVLGGIEGVPLIVLYDQKGEYLTHYLGAIPEEMLEFDFTNYLKAKEE